ncbi:hypothetical protein [Streptomyces sp. NPDC020747]|uniref:hypothetical protein n=1 Tax=Streptomyces sp. NPDC020747 TaxID=3365086 RepID=UPI0037976974
MTMTYAVWNDRARLELALQGVTADLADEVLAEVREHCADSGELPEQAFGAPKDFAAGIAAERVPRASQAKRDRNGTTVSEAWSAVIASVGLVTILAGVVLWLQKGLFVPFTPAGLAGVPIGYAAMVCTLQALVIARPLGKSRTVVPALIVAGVLAVIAACAFVLLPRDVVASIPAPLLLGAGVLLAFWAYSRGTSVELPDVPRNTEEWLAELHGLLEGRHDVARARAGDLVRETVQHLSACGRTPQEEFGPVDQYAMILAQQHPVASPWWRSEATRLWLLVGLAGSFAASAVLSNQPAWFIAVAVATLVGSIGLLVRGAR